MFRVDASRADAPVLGEPEVVDLRHVLRDLTHELLVREAVGGAASFVRPELAIAELVESPGPPPATVWLNRYVGVKPLHVSSVSRQNRNWVSGFLPAVVVRPAVVLGDELQLASLNRAQRD